MEQHLNLPSCPYRLKDTGGRPYIFDQLRKKYVRLTPEEWVRQHMVHYLIHYLGYPPTLMRAECVHSTTKKKHNKRADLVIFDNQDGRPLMVVECKATTQALCQKSIDQVARYNIHFEAPYLAITNGIDHFCLHINKKKNTFILLQELPTYPSLLAGMKPQSNG